MTGKRYHDAIEDATPAGGGTRARQGATKIRHISSLSRGRSGRRVKQVTAALQPNPPSSASSLPAGSVPSHVSPTSQEPSSLNDSHKHAHSFLYDDIWHEHAYGNDSGMPTTDTHATEPKAGDTNARDATMTILEEFRDYWREFVLLWDMLSEGLGDRNIDAESMLPGCASCGAPGATFRCSDCTPYRVTCKDCLVSSHMSMPLHRIKKWNGSFWAETTLKDAGLIVRLGHHGKPCPHSLGKPQDLCVIDLSGVHTISCEFCTCPHPVIDGMSAAQLMNVGWWPATFNRPHTVTTCRTLKLFHSLSAQSKLNVYDFWLGIVRITDGSGIREVPDRYRELKQTVKMFQHIRAAKRAGRGHDNTGIAGTQPGGFALRCIACPIPGVNLPAGWEQAPPALKFLYCLLLAIDANFKLKHKSNKDTDIPLADGFAYFVNSEAYAQHLATHKDTKEMKTCSSSHHAVSGANMPSDSHYDVNGIGAAICARHLLYRAHGVADLKKGEQYVSMDYLFFKMLELTAIGILTFLISYDIACQWSVNIHKRLRKYETVIRLIGLGIMTRFVIPKFHLRAHGQKCRENFSLNFTPGVGRTCGEGVEAGWADCNGAALATREMGKSARREALDDLFSSINWRKTIALGAWPAKSFKEAVEQYETQKKLFVEFERTFPEDTVRKWRDMYNVWVDNPKMPNPFHQEDKSNAVNAARLELAKEDSQVLVAGKSYSHDVTPSAWLSDGIDLENERFDIIEQARVVSDAPASLTELTRRRNTYLTQVNKWLEVQEIYMPSIANPESHLSSSEDVANGALPIPVLKPLNASVPESTGLHLPSSLPKPIRESCCAPGLLEIELKFRLVALDTSLHHIRRQILIKSSTLHNKKIHIDGPGVKANTRSQASLRGINAKLKRWVGRYRRAHAAAVRLEPDGSWRGTFRELEDSDLKPPTSEENGLGVGFRRLGWIWRVQQPDQRDYPPDSSADSGSDTDIHECLRVEWAQGLARVRSWAEEIELCKEEMRRSVTTLLYDANVWRMRSDSRTLPPEVKHLNSSQQVLPEAIKRGLRAFSLRQAAIREGLALSFYSLWAPVLKKQGHNVVWPDELSSLSNNSRATVNSKAVAGIQNKRADTMLDYGTAHALVDDSDGENEGCNDSDASDE